MSLAKNGKRREAFSKSDDFYKLIIERMTDLVAVVSFSIRPKYLYLNPAHFEGLGYEEQELIGKNSFSFVHPMDKLKMLSLLKLYLNGEKGDNIELLEYRVKTKDGSWVYLESKMSVWEDKILIVSRDITEHKKMEEELLRKNEELEKFNKLAVDREMTMIGLKKKITDLEKN